MDDIDRNQNNIDTLYKKTYAEMMSVILHELQHSLFGILMAKERLKYTLNYEDEQLNESLSKIQKISTQIMSFTRNLVNDEKGMTDINNVIQEVLSLSLFKNTKNIIFEVQLSNIQMININKGLLTMVIYNLIINSIESIGEKQNNRFSKGRVSIKTSSNDEKIAISIEDDGNGIKRENIDTAFNFGFSTKSCGSGFGLHFVKKCVEEEWKGTINVESTHTKGAIFTIKIPVNLKSK